MQKWVEIGQNEENGHKSAAFTVGAIQLMKISFYEVFQKKRNPTLSEIHQNTIVKSM